MQLLDDVLVLGRDGMLRSVSSEAGVNGIAAFGRTAAATVTCPSCVELTVSASATLTAAAATDWGKRPFLLTLAGPTALILKARAGSRFLPTMIVWFGSTQVSLDWPSSDGQWAQVTSPLPAGCGRASVDPICTGEGVAITIEAGAGALSIAELDTIAADSPAALALLQLVASGFRAVAPVVRCPPACPGTADADQLVSVVSGV